MDKPRPSDAEINKIREFMKAAIFSAYMARLNSVVDSTSKIAIDAATNIPEELLLETISSPKVLEYVHGVAEQMVANVVRELTATLSTVPKGEQRAG